MSKEIDLELRCDLADDEVRAKAHAVGVAVAEYKRVESAKRDAAKEYGEQLAEIWQRMDRLSQEIESRMERRVVRCEVTFHTPSVGAKTIVRTDTGEVVREEPMTDDERQMHIFEPEQLAPPAQPELMPGFLDAADRLASSVRTGEVERLTISGAGETVVIDKAAAERIHRKAKAAREPKKT